MITQSRQVLRNDPASKGEFFKEIDKILEIANDYSHDANMSTSLLFSAYISHVSHCLDRSLPKKELEDGLRKMFTEHIEPAIKLIVEATE